MGSEIRYAKGRYKPHKFKNKIYKCALNIRDKKRNVIFIDCKIMQNINNSVVVVAVVVAAAAVAVSNYVCIIYI